MTEFLLGAAGQPWMPAVVLVLCIVDGFFPPIPSETLVVGMAALSLSPAGPNPGLLFAAACLGAFVGDNIAYGFGRRLVSSRCRWMQRRSSQAALLRAGAALQSRGIPLILVARFVPVGRVAVSLAAGASGFSARTFRLVTALSSALWAAYSIAVGSMAGHWFQNHPLLGVIVALSFSATAGLLVDKAFKAFHKRKSQHRELAQAGAQAPSVSPAQGSDYASIDS